jgi:N-acetyl-gamma-glutamyl-phosphate reductase
MTKNIGVTIVGGTGYGAKEFLRISESHPYIEIAQIVSTNSPNESLKNLHPNLNKLSSLKTSKEIDLKLLKTFEHKFIILTLPTELSAEFILNYCEKANDSNIHIIDLSGCCRIKNKDTRNEFYPESNTIKNSLLNSFQFGLPELYRSEIPKATNIANPGCYATAAILSLAPLEKLKFINLVVDGKSGSSGAGKSPSETFHHPELNSSSFAYKIGTHRHQAEIKENARIGIDNFIFCPHVIPISRGMLVTSYVTLENETNLKEVLDMFQNFYNKSYFVKMCKNPPKIKDIVGSNFCHLHLYVKNNLIIIISVIDNLNKGMAGQAIQNINLISNLEEQIGLESPALGLV